jgi:hypothetical protein
MPRFSRWQKHARNAKRTNNNFVDFIWDEYGIDWDDIFDWESYREDYDENALDFGTTLEFKPAPDVRFYHNGNGSRPAPLLSGTSHHRVGRRGDEPEWRPETAALRTFWLLRRRR